jgi:hypothetical protein
LERWFSAAKLRLMICLRGQVKPRFLRAFGAKGSQAHPAAARQLPDLGLFSASRLHHSVTPLLHHSVPTVRLRQRSLHFP